MKAAWEWETECRALYRLIEGHCDVLLGVRTNRQATKAAADLRARAQQVRAGRTSDQTTLEDPYHG